MELTTLTRTCKCGIVHRFGSTIDCVKCRCGEQVYGPCSPRKIASVPLVSTGRNAVNPWNVIHGRLAACIKSGQWDSAAEQSWYEADWLKTIPKGNCSCEVNWSKLTASDGYAIDWSTAESAFKSFWKLHNAVSEQHAHRPTLTYEQAYRLWTGPRVGFLADSYSTVGGTETFHRMLLPRLRERLNIVGFVATRHHTGNPAPLKVPYRTGIEAAKKLAGECDILVSWAVPLAKVLSNSIRPKVLAVHHGDPAQSWNYIEENAAWTDAIVGVNPNITNRFPDAVHISNCVDPDRIKPSGKQSELRAKHSIAPDAKIVLYAHRFAKEKQPLKAIEIANALPDDYVMVMAGNGQLYESAKRLTTNRVRLLGPIDSMADWLSIAHCFLSLAICEGYGLSVAEAAAAGVQVISTPTGIAPQIGAHLVYHDAPAEHWVSAIVNAKPTSPNASLCNVDRFVDQWEEAIRCLVNSSGRVGNQCVRSLAAGT